MGYTSGDPSARKARAIRRLALHLDELRQELVGGGDGLRVRLEGALRRDHPDELLGDVDVRLLERAGRDEGAAAVARGAHHRLARGAGEREEVAAHALELIRRR